MAEKNGAIQLVLCRSGRTQWDLTGRLQGDSDMPLADEGRAEVEQAIASFEGPRITVVFAPQDDGCQETARIVAGKSGCKVKNIADLSEVNLGLWEGSLESDVCDRYAKAYRLWREDPSGVTPAEGESLEDASVRLERAIRKVLDRASRSVPAVVLRPVMMGLLKCRLAAEPTSELWALLGQQPPCELVTLRPGDLDRTPEKASVS